MAKLAECTKCGDTKNYNFAIDNGLCNSCIEEILDSLLEECEWVYNESDEYYNTGCGKAWVFNAGSPKDNDAVYCPYCGKKIKIKDNNEANHSNGND